MIPTRRLAWLGAIATRGRDGGRVREGRASCRCSRSTASIVLAALVDALARRENSGVDRGAASAATSSRSAARTPSRSSSATRAAARSRGTSSTIPIERTTTTGLPATFKLPPHGGAAVRYEITPTRARPARSFGAITVRYTSPSGSSRAKRGPSSSERVDVYPDVHAARSLELLRRQGRQDARLGSLRVRGGDTEFERLRPYQRGDEVRHIDWRASRAARRSRRCGSIKPSRTRTSSSRSTSVDAMRGESGGLTSVDHALNAALLAADVALRGGDKAGHAGVRRRAAHVPCVRAAVAPAARSSRAPSYALEAGLAATDYRAAMAFLRSQVRARSLFVVFTNLLEPRSARDLAASMRGLLPRHLPLCVLHARRDVEQLTDGARRAASASSTCARRRRSRSRGATRSSRSCGDRACSCSTRNPEDMTPELVKSYLEIKARRLL